MHWISDDLINWKYEPEGDAIVPDGDIYLQPAHGIERAELRFCDPYVFWNEEDKQYWIVMIATRMNKDGTNRRNVNGLYKSPDLYQWTPHQPLLDPHGMECPDLFQIDDIWYLIGGDTYYYSLNGSGSPYQKPPQRHINQPFTYAGKRMFDGKRHIWTGWIWDTHDMTDEGFSIFGGTMALPLELYPGSREGELCVKPVQEVVQYFSSTLSEVKNISLKKEIPFVLETPKDYMLDMAVSIDEGAKLKLEFNKADYRTGYVYIIDAKERLIDTNCPANPYNFGGVPVKRVNVLIDEKSTIKVQAFMRDNIIEFFVNDAYALNRRAYKLKSGTIKVIVEEGSGNIEYLRIKQELPH